MGDGVGVAQLISPDAWLSVNAHSHLNLIFVELKGWLRGARDLAGSQGAANRAATLDCVCRHSRHVVQCRSLRRLRTGTLVSVDDSGDAPPLLLLLGRRTRYVVAAEDRRGRDPFRFKQLSSHVEIHAVAAVVAVQPQHALTPVHSLDRGDACVHRWPREDVANRARVEKATSHIPREQGQMARAASGY